MKKPTIDTAALDRQNAEFDALTALCKEWSSLRTIAVVDDEYPSARRRYEGKLHDFLKAFLKNRLG